MKILIVEDDPTFRVMLEEWVETWGYDPVCTEDGNTAWDILQYTDAPRLAIIDWMLPGLSGMEVCRKVKNLQHQRPFVYLILLTNKDQEEDLVAAFEGGADDFLRKPVKPEELRCRLLVGKRTLGYQEALADRNEQFQTLFAAMPSLLLFKDGRGRWIQANRQAQELFGVQGVYYEGKTDRELAQIPKAHKKILLAAADADEKAWQHSGLSRQEVELPGFVHREEKFLELIRAPLFSADGSRKGIILLGHDITLRKAVEEQLRHEAYYDMLTNLLNRRYFQEKFHTALAYAKAFNHPLSLCLCDLDDFKAINDTHGHQAGDEVLVQFSHIVRDELRATDLASRFGGDEFCIVFLGTNARNSVNCINRIRQRLRESSFQDTRERIFTISVSFGIAELLNENMEEQDLFKAADEALYLAKQEKGGNPAVIHESALSIYDIDHLPESESGTEASETDRLRDKVRFREDYDELTGLLQNKPFMRQFHALLHQLRNPHQFVSLCLCVIDDFEALRKYHGETAAQEVRRQFSRILQNEMRATDIAGLAEENTFYLAFPGGNMLASLNCMRRIQRQLSETPFKNPQGQLFIASASCGIVEAHQGEDQERLFQDVGKVLELARKSGKGQIRVHDGQA